MNSAPPAIGVHVYQALLLLYPSAFRLGLFRWLRMQFGKNRPLEFEDELPEGTFGLQLNG